MRRESRPISELWRGLAPRVIGAIYRDPTGATWSGALDVIAEAQGASWAQIHLDDHEFSAARISVPNAAADASILTRYVEGGFSLLDPRPTLLTQHDSCAKACWQIIDPAAFDRTSLVNDFLDATENDLRWSMGGGKILESGSRLLFGVARPRRRGPFDVEDLTTLNVLIPHVVWAVELHETLRAAERMARLPAQLGVHGSTALLATDRRGRVVYTNVKGDALLRRGFGLILQNGRLAFETPSVQSAFEAALARQEDGRPLRIDDGKQHYKMHSVPDIGGAVLAALPPIRVLIEVRELSAPSQIGTLSVREREVVDLLTLGLSPGAISVQLGKSVETVRTQIKAAMRKVKVHSQAQLVRAMVDDATG